MIDIHTFQEKEAPFLHEDWCLFALKMVRISFRNSFFPYTLIIKVRRNQIAWGMKLWHWNLLTNIFRPTSVTITFSPNHMASHVLENGRLLFQIRNIACISRNKGVIVLSRYKFFNLYRTCSKLSTGIIVLVIDIVFQPFNSQLLPYIGS